ncbi:unnamed protein product [Heterobilharzia americana]|nr:unnamed protein product [Heterobilharzia americana]
MCTGENFSDHILLPSLLTNSSNGKLRPYAICAPTQINSITSKFYTDAPKLPPYFSFTSPIPTTAATITTQTSNSTSDSHNIIRNNDSQNTNYSHCGTTNPPLRSTNYDTSRFTLQNDKTNKSLKVNDDTSDFLGNNSFSFNSSMSNSSVSNHISAINRSTNCNSRDKMKKTS